MTKCSNWSSKGSEATFRAGTGRPRCAVRRPRPATPSSIGIGAQYPLNHGPQLMNAPAYTVSTPNPALVSYTHWMYALHAASALIGILGSSTIVGAFIFGIPSIVAVVMNYVKRSEARGTYLESHFSWQLRTFWFA